MVSQYRLPMPSASASATMDHGPCRPLADQHHSTMTSSNMGAGKHRRPIATLLLLLLSPLLPLCPSCIASTARASFAAVIPRHRRHHRHRLPSSRRGLVISNNNVNNDVHDDDDVTLVQRLEFDFTNDVNNTKRRSFLRHTLTLTSTGFSMAAAIGAASPLPANAVKGAAEYDLEYYLRDIFLGNKPEGNVPASSTTSIPPRLPRTLRGAFIANLIDDELSSCIPLQELSKLTRIPIPSLSHDVQTLRDKVQSAFRVSHPWNEELVRDEYFFDLTCYAVWKIAAAVIPNDYAKRDLFARNVGRSVVDAIISQSGGRRSSGIGDGNNVLSDKSVEALRSSSSSGRATTSASSCSLTHTVPIILEILNLFQSSGYCSGYRIGDDDKSSINYYDSRRSTGSSSSTTKVVIFDNLDDEEISTQGGSVNCLVSIYDPATLGSALQITGEGSRFVPDFVGTTLAALWERMLNGDSEGGGGVVINFESYFVDPIYRPNPKVRGVMMSRIVCI